MEVLLPKLPVLPVARVPQMLNGCADWLPKLARSHAFRLDLPSKCPVHRNDQACETIWSIGDWNRVVVCSTK